MSRLRDLARDTVSSRLFRAMRVDQVSGRGPFREISLTSVTRRDTSWRPGDKVQVRVAPDGMTVRTYTPVRWASATGGTTILVYLHGAGPGAAWAHDVAAGDTVPVFGPRRSLDLGSVASAPIFVGDETSVGLRVAWTAAHPNLEPVSDLFELGADSPAALRALGLEPIWPQARPATRQEDVASLPPVPSPPASSPVTSSAWTPSCYIGSTCCS